MTDIRAHFAHQGLSRPRDRRVLGGVCSGLGRRLELEPWTARLLFVLLLLVVPGSQLLVYPVLWILMPEDAPVPPAMQPTGQPTGQPTVQEPAWQGEAQVRV